MIGMKEAPEETVHAHIIPWEQMTVEQKRDHLMNGHGFFDYETFNGEPYYLRSTDEKQLDLVHADDHRENMYGGSAFCQHAHDKVSSGNNDKVSVRSTGG